MKRRRKAQKKKATSRKVCWASALCSSHRSATTVVNKTPLCSSRLQSSTVAGLHAKCGDHFFLITTSDDTDKTMQQHQYREGSTLGAD